MWMNANKRLSGRGDEAVPGRRYGTPGMSLRCYYRVVMPGWCRGFLDGLVGL